MALLQAGINPLVIWMVGHWKSWAMARCLHRAATSTRDLAAWMLVFGNFAITTHPALPDDAATVVAPLLTEESDYQLLIDAN